MASRALDDFENDWTFVDKDGKVDIEVSYVFNFFLVSDRNVVVLQEFFKKQGRSSGKFCLYHLDKFMKTV